MADHDPERGGGHPSIDVLMAAYDGEHFVAEQIESILRQSHAGWKLTVRDDCSTDGTLAIVRDYARRHPDRITAQVRTENSGSAKQNFLEMLLRSEAPYVMFSDDDDVWLEDKITLTVDKMRELESRFGADVPLLVHSDLAVTDEHLEVTSRSMMDARQLDPAEGRLARLIQQNVATGCTVMVNRPLADLVREPFGGAIEHDWWLALIASAFGRIGFVDVPTMLYRQHARNAVGARPSKTISYIVARFRDRSGTTTMQAQTYTQVAAFLEHFEERLSPEQAEMLRAYTSIPQRGKVGRLRVLRRYGFWKNTVVRRVAQVLFV